MDSDIMTRILTQVSNDVPKDKAVGFEMDDEASALWDKLVTEVADAKAKGFQIDVPGEWPMPDDAPPAAPAAVDTPPAADQPPPAAPAPEPAPAPEAAPQPAPA